MQLKWLEWAKQIQGISQAGLEYSKDMYDIERFEQLRALSVEIMHQYTDVEVEKVQQLFASETGYATPKVDIRAVVFQQDKILMVREKQDGAWALPGGWGDIGLSPKQIAVKETREESGFEVEAVRLLGVADKNFHNHPPSPWHVYKFFILCRIVGGEATVGDETSDVGFFAAHELPPLSVERNTEEQMLKMFDCMKSPHKTVFCD